MKHEQHLYMWMDNVRMTDTRIVQDIVCIFAKSERTIFPQ